MARTYWDTSHARAVIRAWDDDALIGWFVRALTTGGVETRALAREIVRRKLKARAEAAVTAEHARLAQLRRTP